MTPVIRELITDASVDALNTALAQHDLTPESIIAIHFLETNEGSGPGRVRRQFRVLYKNWARD